jgi:hypothetical protein
MNEKLTNIQQASITALTANQIKCLGKFVITNNTKSTSSTNGALTILGGVGVSGDMNINGNICVEGGFVKVKKPISACDAANKSYVDSQKYHFSKEFINSNGNVRLDSIQSSIKQIGNLDNLECNGQVSFFSKIDSENVHTGACTIKGGLGVVKNVYIGGNLNIKGLLKVHDIQVSEPTLPVHAANKEYVDKRMDIKCTNGLRIINKNTISLDENQTFKSLVVDSLITNGSVVFNGLVVVDDPKHSSNVANKKYVDDKICKPGKGLFKNGTVLDVSEKQTQITQIGTLHELNVNGNITSGKIYTQNIKSQLVESDNFKVVNAVIKDGEIENIFSSIIKTRELHCDSIITSTSCKTITESYKLELTDHYILCESKKDIKITLPYCENNKVFYIKRDTTFSIDVYSSENVLVDSIGLFTIFICYFGIWKILEKSSVPVHVVEPLVVEPLVVEPLVVKPLVVEPLVLEPLVVEPDVVFKQEPFVVEPVVKDLVIVTSLQDVFINSDTILNRDFYALNLTIQNGVQVKTNGFRIIIESSLVLHENSVIHNNGFDAVDLKGGKDSNTIMSFLGKGFKGSDGSKCFASDEYTSIVGKIPTLLKNEYCLIKNKAKGGQIITKSINFIQNMLPEKFGGSLVMNSSPYNKTGRLDSIVNFNTGLGGGEGCGGFITLPRAPTYTDCFTTGAGGGSAGIIIICAKSITGTGSISAVGGNGSNAVYFGNNSKTVTVGGGGGGCGGIISIIGCNPSCTVNVKVNGGNGGNGVGFEDGKKGLNGIDGMYFTSLE